MTQRTSLAGVLVLCAAVGAKAMMIAPPVLSQRVATADAVVVGKVTGFADKSVAAVRYPGGTDTVNYQIALVKVEDVLLGPKGAKTVRVGFLPPPPPAPPGGRGARPMLRRYPQANLTVNQEACLFLTKHPAGDFYVLAAYYDVLSKAGNVNFEKEVAEVRRCAKLLAGPKAGLGSANKDERTETAVLLVARYRTQRWYAGKPPKAEPVDAAQSKAILTALADADWTITNPRQAQASPQAMFGRLGLTEKDGWAPPQDARRYADEAKAWLKGHADSYRIQRFVNE
ncbi:MAG TPA: hypothetical protein VFE78_32295 [Gemmataceae bacterium]|nr:hypothetical protein [Gemmataceae bacterium]